jgi:hypothetical protein
MSAIYLIAGNVSDMGHLTAAGTAFLLGPDAYYTSRRAQIVALSARYALPTMYAV